MHEIKCFTNSKLLTMKKVLLSSIFTIAMFLGYTAFGQSTLVELSIIQNGPMLTDTLDDGTVVTYATSSDDAEQ